MVRYSMKVIASLAVSLTLLLSTAENTFCITPSSSEAVRVLIVTGGDLHHDWRATTPVLRGVIQQDSRLKVDELRDFSKLKNTDLSPYSVVVINFKNTDANSPGRGGFDNLRDYVRDGGGLVLVHFACGAFEEFKEEYKELVGRVWMGRNVPPGRRQHDPRGPFNVNITDPAHPITAGMTTFGTDDELYTCLEGDADVKVLAVATSIVDGRQYPMALLHSYGKGRVFNCTLGHDARALLISEVGQLYRRGCAWSAGLLPVPQKKPPID